MTVTRIADSASPFVARRSATLHPGGNYFQTNFNRSASTTPARRAGFTMCRSRTSVSISRRRSGGVSTHHSANSSGVVAGSACNRAAWATSSFGSRRSLRARFSIALSVTRLISRLAYAWPASASRWSIASAVDRLRTGLPGRGAGPARRLIGDALDPLRPYPPGRYVPVPAAATGLQQARSRQVWSRH